MNYKFYANGKCTYVGTVEASSKEEALRKIKKSGGNSRLLVAEMKARL